MTTEQTSEQTAALISRFTAGDTTVTSQITRLAMTSDDPMLLAAAALAHPGIAGLLTRASHLAVSTRHRQVVAIVAAYLNGDHDRADALARDYLTDHLTGHSEYTGGAECTGRTGQEAGAPAGPPPGAALAEWITTHTTWENS